MAIVVNDGAPIAQRKALAPETYTVTPLPSGGVVVRIHHSASAHVSITTQGSPELERVTWRGALGLGAVFAFAAAIRERSRRRLREPLAPPASRAP